MKKKGRKKPITRKATTCKCCELLKAEVSFLRSIISPKREVLNPLPRVTFEADSVLGGQDHQTDFSMNPKYDERQAEIDSEAAKLLAGNY